MLEEGRREEEKERQTLNKKYTQRDSLVSCVQNRWRSEGLWSSLGGSEAFMTLPKFCSYWTLSWAPLESSMAQERTLLQ